MMIENAGERSVRQSRRQAALARDIVAEHTGPWKTIEAMARKNPALAIAVAVLAGMIAGRLLKLTSS
jgi:ElaB/YqjD/DUF883 family membrane-anchored ribosome-binding protein